MPRSPRSAAEGTPLLRRVGLDDLTIEDERSYRHIGLFEPLKEIVRRTDYRFAIPSVAAHGAGVTPADALFLNLAYWTEETQGDVLAEDVLPADVLLHVAWHLVADAFLPRCARGEIMGEAIASAFDLYLVGRLLGHAGNADFLETQVPRMAEAAAEAGASEEDFEALLTRATEAPEAAFEGLRALLYETTCALASTTSIDEAIAILHAARKTPYGPLLHHYELATWVQKSRGRLSPGLRATSAPSAKTAAADVSPSEGARGSANDAAHAAAQTAGDVDRFHEALKSQTDAVAWLEVNWVIQRLDDLRSDTVAAPRETQKR